MKQPENVKIAHIRYPAEDGSIDNRGGITIAAQVNENHQVIKYAVAKCNRIDNFVKRSGWNKAVGRVMSKTKHKVPNKPIEWRDLVGIYRDNAAVGAFYNGVI